MSAYERITMSLREVDRLKVIQAVTEGFLTPTRAAQRLQLTTRQVHRLVQRYRDTGVSGLISRKRGQPSNHQLRPGLERRAVTLIRTHYQDFGPTLAAEKLAECHGLRLAKETVRRIMMDAGLWTPRRARPPKVYQPRNRRACLGELIQIDGIDHRWFEDRAPACTLLVYIDDATSRLMHLAFTRSESTFSYFQATRAYLEHHGKPVALYSDKASVFRVNSKDAQGRCWSHAFRSGHVRAEHRYFLRQLQPGQGARRACPSHPAGSPGQGAATTKSQHCRGGERLSAVVHG